VTAIRLDRDDIDHRHQLLRVIDSKFGKSRELPLHETTMHALDNYAQLRDRLCPPPSCEAFFISRNGTQLLSQCVHRVFARLVSTVGLEPRSGRRRPRPRDLRHSFAVSTLLDWYATDTTNVQARLPSLSTYMGHVEPANTYYYLPPRRSCSRARPDDSNPPGKDSDDDLAPTLEAYFTDRLRCQRRVSPNTGGQLPRRVPAAARLRATEDRHPRFQA
jgi:integrase